MDAALLTPLALAGALSVSSFGAEPAELVSVAPGLAITASAGSRVSTFHLPGGSLLETEIAQGKVSAVAAGQSGSAWIEQASGGATLQVRLTGGADVKTPLPKELNGARLAWMGDSIALLGDQGGEIYDPRGRRFIDPKFALPAEAAGLFEQSYVQSSPSGLVAFIRPYSLIDVPGGRRTLSAVTMFAVSGSQWRELGSAATTAPRYAAVTGAKFDAQGRYTRALFKVSAPRIALDEVGFMALEDDKVLRVPFARGAWTPERRAVEGPAPAWSEQIAAIGNRLWRLNGTRLISQDLATGALSAHLPSADIGAPKALLNDGAGLWMVTDKGTHRVAGAADAAPVSGFLRVPLVDEPLAEPQARLLAELSGWLGTKYVYGGNTRAGVDCSGLVVQAYLALGYRLPRQSALLRDSELGVLVQDALKVGDVIWTPGHVAVYAGRGEVIEAVRRGVSRNPVWRFKGPMVVRRFLR